LLAIMLPAAAWAGRPLQTEDAGIIDAGHWEVESAWSRVRLGAAASTDRYLQLGRGIGWNSQLAVALGRADDDGERASRVNLNGKTELWSWGADDNPAALTLAWAVESRRASDDVWRHATTAFNLVHSRPLGETLTLHLNLGHNRDELAHQRITSWNVALEHAGFETAGGTIAWMGELFGDDRRAVWCNAALRWTVRPDAFWLDASYGRQVTPDRASLLTLGLKVAF
jgi:hypothetical protein